MGSCYSQVSNYSPGDYKLTITGEKEILTARLLTAINTSDVSIIRECAEAGADLNWHNGAPLRFAINNCHIKIVKLLLELGADPVLVVEDFYGPEITTLLRTAVSNQEIDIMENVNLSER